MTLSGMNLGQLRTYVRLQLAEDIAAFWTDPMLNTLINAAYLEVYAEITLQGKGHFETSFTIAYVPGQQLYAFPNPVDKIVLVERTDTAPQFCKYNLLPIDITQKNQYQDFGSVSPNSQEFYFITGNNIGIAPTPQQGNSGIITIWNVPTPNLLLVDADTLPPEMTAMNHELVAQGAIWRASRRDRENLALYAEDFKRLWQLLKALTNARQTQQPTRIIDGDPDV